MKPFAPFEIATRCALILWGIVGFAHATPITLWQIGDDEDPYASGYAPTDEFSQESGSSNNAPGLVTRLPGDPLYNAASNPARDDHFYTAGTYPIGFNSIVSTLVVPNTEPTSAFERAITNTDPNRYIHFLLNASQAGSQSRLRLTFELVDGATWSSVTGNGENFGSHDITVRFRTATTNTLVLQRNGVDRPTRFTIDIPASSVSAVASANTIQMTRSGPTPPANTYAWVQFDFVKLEVDTDGMADGDNDGLPRWWENDNHLSDSNAGDATQDADGDGLTALQEYNGGVMSSDPLRVDTDGDGVNDAAERAAGSNPNLTDTDGDALDDKEELVAPTSSPVLTDTDSDGSPDAWEKRVGSNPSSNASVPVAFAGAIGINFVCSPDPDGAVPSIAPAGVVPQMKWNNTVALRNYSRSSGATVDIASPSAGAISKSNGALVPGMTMQWTSSDNGVTANNGSPDRKLMDGFIRASSSTDAVLTLQGIPFSTYHVLAYVGGSYDTQQASVQLNNETATVRPFITTTTSPQSEWVEIVPPTQAIPAPVGNFVRYPNRTGSSLTIRVKNVDGYSVGLHAVQIVDASLDADASGIPDWYEVQYRLEPAGPSTASADPDGDGLTNLQEYQRGSDPRKSDTDGDGLADNLESAANALSMDSDGDGIGDYEETKGAIPSNPSLKDSDGDGISDKVERQLGMDPTVNQSSAWTPVYSASPAKWEWKLDPVQLVWDHGGGATGGGDGYDDTLVSFQVGNVQMGSDSSIDLRLLTVNGSLTYQFEAAEDEAFSAANQPNSNIYLVDGNNPRTDLKSALGFSGFGSADISDKLRFRLLATRGAGNVWSLTFEIFNVTRNTTVVSRVVSQSTAATLVDAGTATWQNENDVVGLPTVDVHRGVQVFFTPSSLESLPAFAAYADADNDGMPDAWEDANQLLKNSAADATQDADGDGLKNRDEYFAGTNPRLTDTDGDGVDDRVEHEEGSNPLVATLRPAFAGGTAGSGTDFNHNGLPDAWEARFKAAGVSLNADSDGDGSSNAREAMWGTDPFDNKSRIDLAMQRSGNDALLSWTRMLGKRQRIYRSINMSGWQFLSLPFTASGNNDTARVTGQFTSSPLAFFAIETKDRDSDGDGVADWDELFMGSDPYQRDSMRSGAMTIDAEGNVSGSVSGDYATFSEYFRNALPGGSSSVTREQAARFLQQSTFGPTMAEMDRVQSMGFASWIDDQISTQAASYHRPIMESMVRDLRGPQLDLTYDYNGNNVSGSNGPTAFARCALKGGDQLRQRVAFALSQILVTSRHDANLADRPLAMAAYYDIFVRNAFGSYRDVLGQVAAHPVMGRYLSHIGNQKARPEINQYPDENFARECMQLFSIGLWELNSDGTRKVDANGKFIPTYDNGDITEMARVFTGYWFGGQSWGDGGWLDAHSTVPMTMWPEKHDFGAKSMLGSLSIPARSASAANGQRDVDDALDFLFNHPNCGPFICKQLIQFLVTNNPSKGYVSRVSAVFANNGQGKRGDLGAVVKAILLDSEARDAQWSHGSTTYGRLKDPVYRAMSLARAGRLSRFSSVNWWDYGDFYDETLQSPGNSPSVFNFYRTEYRAPGTLADNQMASGAFQITNSYTSIAIVNRLWDNTVSGLRLYSTYGYAPDYRDLLEVASTPPQLVDRVNLLFCGGMMSSTTRASILNALTQVSSGDPLQRVQLAVFLATACPEGAIQR